MLRLFKKLLRKTYLKIHSKITIKFSKLLE